MGDLLRQAGIASSKFPESVRPWLGGRRGRLRRGAAGLAQSAAAAESQPSFLVPLLATIPLGDARPGDIITWTASGPDYEAHVLNTRSFQTVEVDIRDTKGRSIDFNNYDLRIQIGIRKSQ